MRGTHAPSTQRTRSRADTCCCRGIAIANAFPFCSVRLGSELDAERKRAATAEAALAALRRGTGAAQEARLKVLKAEASSALRAAAATPSAAADAGAEDAATVRGTHDGSSRSRMRRNARPSSDSPLRCAPARWQALAAARAEAEAARAEAATLAAALAEERAAREAAEEQLLRLFELSRAGGSGGGAS